MQLSFLKDKANIDNFIYLERYVNNGSPSGYTLDKWLENCYLPNSEEMGINLPVFWVPFQEITVVGNFCKPFFVGMQEYGIEKIPFPVHPAILDIFGVHKTLKQIKTQSSVFAQPLASGRTLTIKRNDTEAIFVKLHFPKRLGRISRALPLYKWLSSLENSKEFCRLINDAPKSCAYFPYIGGAFLEGDGNIAGGGFLIRSTHPYPYKLQDTFLIPAFSLWSSDKHYPDDLPLLIQIVTLLKMSQEQILNLLLIPIFETYKFCVLDCGLIWEDNAQNVVFEISHDFSEVRVIRRDMEHIFKDEEFRPDTTLYPLCIYHSTRPNIHDDLQRRRSFGFDFKLSRYIIDPIIDCLHNHLNWKKEAMQHYVREMSLGIIKWPDKYFPDKRVAYGYPRKDFVSRNNYIELEDSFLYR